jgi:hypothetical protein
MGSSSQTNSTSHAPPSSTQPTPHLPTVQHTTKNLQRQRTIQIISANSPTSIMKKFTKLSNPRSRAVGAEPSSAQTFAVEYPVPGIKERERPRHCIATCNSFKFVDFGSWIGDLIKGLMQYLIYMLFLTTLVLKGLTVTSRKQAIRGAQFHSASQFTSLSIIHTHRFNETRLSLRPALQFIFTSRHSISQRSDRIPRQRPFSSPTMHAFITPIGSAKKITL